MRELLPHPAEEADLHAVYGRSWSDAGGLRMNFVSSADGAAQVEGLSKGLQTPGDNAVFAALRDLADVVVVGAGTAVAENYKPAEPSGARLSARRAHGYADTLPIALVSNSLGFDASGPLFDDPPARTLVLTCASAPSARRAVLADVAEVVLCGSDAVEPALVRSALRERGLTRILCEGGPTLFGSFAAAGAVDELCLSLSPLLGGPDGARIVAGPGWSDTPLPMALTGLLEDDGALFLRYRFTR